MGKVPKNNSQEAYEQAFSSMLGPDVRAFSFWKGRVALYAILRALGVGAGDEVLVAGFTCVVVPNAIRFLGAKPVYADISTGSYNLDPISAARAISPRTRAMIVQHTFGIPAPLEELLALAKLHDLAVIEDCAHSLGSAYRGKPLGTFGNAAFFSSQWSKPYTTGMGGVAITRASDLAVRLARIQQAFAEPSFGAQQRLSIQYWFYQRFFTSRFYWLAQGLLQGFGRMGLAIASSSSSELAGSRPHDYEWRMGGTQCSAGMHQLEGALAGIQHRRLLAARYDAGLLGSRWPIARRDEEDVLLRYPIMVQNKKELLQRARAARVELGSWFETPLHPVSLSQHVFFGYSVGQCPNSEAAASQIVNLPLHQRVTIDEADRVLEFFLKNAVGPSE